ncbi:MAG: hypothetical protein QXT45_05495 [Candidatus Bilamarchaeaceae archaeon]
MRCKKAYLIFLALGTLVARLCGAQENSIFIPAASFSVLSVSSNNAVPVYAPISGSGAQNVVLRYNGDSSSGFVHLIAPVVIPPGAYNYEIADIMFIPRQSMVTGDAICYLATVSSVADNERSGYTQAEFDGDLAVHPSSGQRSGYIAVVKNAGELVRGSHTTAQDSLSLLYSGNYSTLCTSGMASTCGMSYGRVMLTLGSCKGMCLGSGNPFSCCTGFGSGCNTAGTAPYGPGGDVDFVGIRLRFITQ